MLRPVVGALAHFILGKSRSRTENIGFVPALVLTRVSIIVPTLCYGYARLD